MSYKLDPSLTHFQPLLHELMASLNQQLNPLLPALSPEETQLLLRQRQEQLIATHRLELSTRPLEYLTKELSFSPHVTKDNFLSLIGDCQELFYSLRNDSPKSLTDEDLIDLLIDTFTHQTKGSIEGTRHYFDNWTRDLIADPLTYSKEADTDD